MSGGISRRHVRMGSPNVRALPVSEACAATESPNGPGAHDCGVDAIHVSQPTVPASFGRCARATTASP